MKPKHLIVLALLLVAAVVLAMLVSKKGDPKTPDGALSAGDALLPEFAVNDVAQIKVAGPTGSAELKRSEGKWGAADRAGYPVDFDKVRRALRAVADLKVGEVIRAGESALGRFELGADTGKVAEFFDDSGKSLTKLVIGKNFAGASTGGQNSFPTGNGIYLRDAAREGQVFIVQERLADLVPTSTDWLVRGTVNVAKHQSVEITHPGGEVATFSRADEAGTMTLAGLAEDEEMNAANTGTLTTAFSNGSFKDVVVGDAAKPENTGLDKPVKVAVKTFDGFSYQFDLGKVAPPAPAAPEGEDGAAATPPVDPEYYFSFDVTAEIASERVVAEGTEETEEEKETRDKDFATERKQLEERFAKEKSRAGIVYQMDKWAAEKFFSKRADLVKKKEDPAAAGGAGAAPPTGAVFPGAGGKFDATTLPLSVQDALNKANGGQ